VTDQKRALCFAFLIPILFTLFAPFSAIDLAVWIAHGEYFLHTGSLLRHDIFSVLPTSELIYPSAGLSIFYAWIYRWVGLSGVCLFHVFLVLPLVLFILYWPLWKAGLLSGPGPTKWYLFSFWLGAVPLFVERPAMVALIPFAISFQMISKIDHGLSKKDLALFILMEMLWVNLHGSFVLLPLMLGWKLFLRTKGIRNLIKSGAVLVLIVLSSLINPFGVRVYPYLLETARLSKERSITEWGFPTLTAQFPTGVLFWALFIFAVFILIQKFKREKNLSAFSHPFYLILILGLFSIRNAALAFVVLLPWAHSMGLLSPIKENKDSKNSTNLIAISVLCLAIPFVFHFKPRAWDETVAFELSDTIKKDGRSCAIFNAWELGSFLMLELPNKIYLDSRNIIYTKTDFDSYKKTLQGDSNYESFLEKGHVCFVLVDKQQGEGLIKRLDANSNWEIQGNVGAYVLYAKKKF